MNEILIFEPTTDLEIALRKLYDEGIELTPDLIENETIKEILDKIWPTEYCVSRYRRMALMSVVSERLGFKKTVDGVWRNTSDMTEAELNEKWLSLQHKQQSQQTKYGVKMQELEEVAKERQLDIFGDDLENGLSYDSPAEKNFARYAQREGIELEHNPKVSNDAGSYYKLDYIILIDGKRTRFSVEIMSEKYHKYQLSDDYERVRQLNAKGLFVILITANTVYGRPVKTAKQIKRIITKWDKLVDIML